jgi:hypothetical protein
MRYRIEIEGVSPLIVHNGAAGLDTQSPENKELRNITSKRGQKSESDEARIRELECAKSLYIKDDDSPTIPESMIRACVENAARKSREGPNVREGFLVESVDAFDYDTSLGTTKAELAKTIQFTVPVVVQRARILRTRGMFKQWGVVFTVDTDPELIDLSRLETWLNVAGRRIGLGDWRPQKSGQYGRFVTRAIEPLGEY